MSAENRPTNSIVACSCVIFVDKKCANCEPLGLALAAACEIFFLCCVWHSWAAWCVRLYPIRSDLTISFNVQQKKNNAYLLILHTSWIGSGRLGVPKTWYESSTLLLKKLARSPPPPSPHKYDCNANIILICLFYVYIHNFIFCT